MRPDASIQNGGGSGIMGGMSRAAKKRNKNKKKNNDKRPMDNIEKSESTMKISPKKAKLVNEADKFEQKVKATKLSPKKAKLVDEADKFEQKVKAQDKAAEHVPMNKDADEPVGEAPVILDSADDEYIPSLPNTPLTEILLLKDIEDKEKKTLLENLTAYQRATCLFQAMIEPIPIDQFYKEYWEKKPLLVRAKNRKRYDGLLSLESIKTMTKTNPFYYAKDLNVTRYQKDKDGVKRRITLDKLPTDEKDQETGVEVDPKELWSNYKDGCTIRLLCPHKHADNIHALLSTLELELQCMVGANAYLTPPGTSQGFAPHYDDVEAFCLQLQGSKRWKVYEPNIKLPRVSSEDFTPEDLEGIEPALDITLEEGDLLYMPRGWIHQACTLKENNEHSLHLTVSAMQQWAWVDLLEMVMPEALEAAADNESSAILRQGLPRGFLDYMGAIYEEPSDEKLPDSLKKVGEEMADENILIRQRRMLQEKFRADAKKRIMKVAKTAYEMIDGACDQVAKRFMSGRQPFVLTKPEREQTSKADGEDDEEKQILPNTLCRLARPGIARLIIEDDAAVVYHCGDNSREYEGNPLSPVEFELDDGAALEQLLTTVEPHWIFVNDLYHDTIEDKIAIAQSLYDEGILAIKVVEEVQE
jgi:lysine-specific demethylase/histidyl-hydroxylase NO66